MLSLVVVRLSRAQCFWEEDLAVFISSPKLCKPFDLAIFSPRKPPDEEYIKVFGASMFIAVKTLTAFYMH